MVFRTLIFVRDRDRRKEIEKAIEPLRDGLSHPLLNARTFGFHFIWAPTLDAFAQEVIDALYGSGFSQPLIALSDAFGTSENPSDLSNVVRGAYHLNRQLCVLINSPADLAKAAARLTLLAPAHLTNSTPSGRPISFRAVESREELKECFSFRHVIYDVLGYLDPLVSGSRSRLDVDFHDSMALHFAAFDEGKIVGTLRVVVPHQPWGASRWKEVFQSHQNWFRLTIPDIAERDLRERMRHSGLGPLPMLQNVPQVEAWYPLLTQVMQGVEISRLIVHPEYRDMGISRSLLHFGLSTAWELGKRLIFAECLPTHVDMYGKHGFQALQGHTGSIEPRGPFSFTPESLYLDLNSDTAGKPLAHYDCELFKLANPALKEEQLTQEPKHVSVQRA